jgi:hypothetical protein
VHTNKLSFFAISTQGQQTQLYADGKPWNSNGISTETYLQPDTRTWAHLQGAIEIEGIYFWKRESIMLQKEHMRDVTSKKGLTKTLVILLLYN